MLEEVMEEATASEQAELVGAKLVCLYSQSDGLLTPHDYPVVLLYPCALCSAPCPAPPCTGCGCSYCPVCGPCRYCDTSPEDFEDSPRDPPLLEITSEISADTGSTEELVVGPDLYEKLRDDLFRGVPLPFDDAYLVQLHLPLLSDCEIEDEIVTKKRTFGTSGADFQRLARNLAWELPAGLLVVNLDRKRTLLFAKEYVYQLQVRDIHSALSWMRNNVGSFGLCVKGRGHRVDCTLIGVVNYIEHGEEYLERRRETVMREIFSWH